MINFLARTATDAIPGNTVNPSQDDWLNMFYTADNLQTKDQVESKYSGISGTSTTNFVQRFAYLKNGAWLLGNGSDWAPLGQVTSFDDLRYPDTTFSFINTDELSGSELAFTTSTIMKGKTPVPNHVA